MTNANTLKLIHSAANTSTCAAAPTATTPRTTRTVHRTNSITKTRRLIQRKALMLQLIGKLLLVYALLGEFAIGLTSYALYSDGFIGAVGAVIACIASVVFGIVHILLASYVFGSAASVYAESQKLRKMARGGR